MSEERTSYDAISDTAVAEAKRVLDADRQERAEEAARRIQPILEELRCELRAFVVIGGQAVAVPVQVAAQ